MLDYFLYTISLIVFWGLLLLDPNKPGLFGIFVAMVYTFYSAFIIRSFVEKETRLLTATKFLGPIIYVVVFLFAQPFNLYSIIAPINVAFLLFCIALSSKDAFPKKEVQFFVVAFIYLYSFSLYNIWDNASRQQVKKNQYDFGDSIQVKEKYITKKIPNLDHYPFLNSNLDTVTLAETGKYTIIETWNERCLSCFKAMNELADFYPRTDSKANQYYVYIPTKNRKTDYTKVFAFDKIKDKNRILIDVNLQESAFLNEFPVFFVFSPSGELVFSQIGYKSDAKEELKDGIMAVLK